MNYDPIAPVYDCLAAVYTLGGIRHAKHAHLALIQPGESVLYAGAGGGEECVAAARLGARVTAVDASERMIRLCKRRFQRAKQQAEFIQADVRSARLPQSRSTYDVVVAPFFLNIFPMAALPEVMRSLVSRVRPGGRFICVDFRAPVAGLFFRVLQKAYYLPPLALFYLIARNPWHPLYDYQTVASNADLPLRLSANIIEKAWGLPLLETLVWEKQCSV